MTLQEILKHLKTAPEREISRYVQDKIQAVDVEDEAAVRELFRVIYEEEYLHDGVSAFVAQLVNPEYTGSYPLK
mgnify:CR=1 FL=1